MSLESSSLTLGVIGLGHVGLPTAVGFAEVGWRVLAADHDAAKTAQLRRGVIPFYEVGLEEALRRHLQNGRLELYDHSAEAIRGAAVLFVCVDTPPGESGVDLTQIEAVTRTIAAHLNGYKLIVQKSTAPVRTAQWMKETLLRRRHENHEVDVAVNPEFLQEGMALHDVLHPDRIVLGVDSEQARLLMERLYRPVLEQLPGPGECVHCIRLGRDRLAERLVLTDPVTAEVVKYAANAFLATKISFINMVADLCEAVGADVTRVAEGIGLDPRIGRRFLNAGIGFGGSCLPKDLGAFIHTAGRFGVDFSLLREAARVNDRRIEQYCEKVRRVVGGLAGKTVGVLGLAFKPGTDDVREAPSLKIVARMLKEGIVVQVHDPRAVEAMQGLFPEDSRQVVYCATPYEAARDADALLLLTEWEEYRDLDFTRIRTAMRTPIVVDGRNFFDPAALRRLGFAYYGIGR